jgi:NADH:ubiquinone oxidoreductase subunit D
MKNKLLKIGTIVYFYNLYKSRNKNIITWTRSTAKQIGVITGCTFRHNGIYHKGSNSYGWDGDGDYDSSYLESTECLKVYRIRKTLMGKEVFSLVDDTIIHENQDMLIPNKIGYKWTERDKEEMRSIAKDLPRDEKGRFV